MLKVSNSELGIREIGVDDTAFDVLWFQLRQLIERAGRWASRVQKGGRVVAEGR